MATPAKSPVLLDQSQPATLVAAATTTGVANSYVFACPAARNDQPRTLTVVSSGTFSVATVTLLVSADGTTYQALGTAQDFKAAGVIQFSGMVPGVSYKLSVTSFTGTSITLVGVIS